MDNIKNDYALDMSKLVNQLRVKAGVMEMGERIAWGSDTALMREAADRIEALEEVVAAPDVQGVPVGWQCVWPGGGTFTTDSYESAKNYQEGAISSHGEDQAPFIRPLFADPKSAEQQPESDVARHAAMRFALSEMVKWYENISLGNNPAFQYYNLAKKALLSAAYRKGGADYIRSRVGAWQSVTLAFEDEREPNHENQ